MNEKAKKYVDLFRRVKIAAAATVDAEGHPQARIINVMLAEDDGMYIVTSRGKPFYKQLVETGEIALAAMCPDCQSLKFTGKLRVVDKSWVDKVFAQNPGMNEVYPGERKRVAIRGAQISDAIVQINMKVVEYGPKTIEEILNPAPEGEAPAES